VEREGQIRAAFTEQAMWCTRLGSPFTARLCEALAAALDPETPVGARILAWPGDPSASVDALALRLCGGLNAMVRGGQAPGLASLYPPAPLPEFADVRAALVEALRLAALEPWLDSAPQTNEVGRSAMLTAGLLVAAARFDRPMILYELGASAGLNLQLDRYSYDLGGLNAGDPDSALRLTPRWRGPPPPAGALRIVGRQGVDLNPIDPVHDRERLLAYIWPDQAARLAQAEAALAIARHDPPRVDMGDAADWIEAKLRPADGDGALRVVMHSIAFQYFPASVQARVASHIERAGAAATEEAPLAWLRFEKLPDDDECSLRLRLWPGEDRLLAWAHPHATSVDYLG